MPMWIKNESDPQTKFEIASNTKAFTDMGFFNLLKKVN